jgi:mycothiol system anti-sigma-R factor
MRSDEEIAKAVEEILRAKSARSLQGAGDGGVEDRAGVGDGPDGFRDRADSPDDGGVGDRREGLDRGSGGDGGVLGAGVGGPCGAPGSLLEGSCEEVADHLFELLDAQMPLEAAARLRRHCETCPHCSELTEAEIHVREIVKRSCCAESAPVSLRMRVTNQIAVYRSTTA